MTEEKKSAPPIFLNIGPDVLPQELDAFCFGCHQEGKTTILLTKIPFFREVMISHFECPHCGMNNNAVQFAGEFPAKGVHYVLHAQSPEDLNRRVVKSLHGVVSIPAIGLQIPGPTQGDSISTVEGVLEQAYRGLAQSNPEPTPEMSEFLSNLHQCAKGLVQFDFILDDPSGNSFIENPNAPAKDPLLEVTFYKRTPKQSEDIGLMSKPNPVGYEIDEESMEHINSSFAQDSRVQTFPTDCPVCSTPGESRSCTLQIPHFKEIIIMSFNCENCSYHNGEVMVGGEISDKALKITLNVKSREDLNRELIKSETASIILPDINLELVPGTLGGKFTTVEGILNDIYKNLNDNNPFTGDSSDNEQSAHFKKNIDAVLSFSKLEQPFTLIIEDSLSNSYVQKYADNEENLIVEERERTQQENENLGLTDMKTEEFVTYDDEPNTNEAATSTEEKASDK